MKNIKIFSLIEVLILSCIFSACGKQSDAESETEEAAAVEKLTLVNTKSEVKTQIESLASKYAQYTYFPHKNSPATLSATGLYNALLMILIIQDNAPSFFTKC